MHLKKIGVENFRVFGEKTNFSFRPITVLTGKNSSGKSSLNKLLLLLKSNFGTSKSFDELKLDDDFSNLHSSEKIKSWGIENDYMTLVFDFPLRYFGGECTLHLSYDFKQSEFLDLRVIEIRNKGKMLFKYEHNLLVLDDTDLYSKWEMKTSRIMDVVNDLVGKEIERIKLKEVKSKLKPNTKLNSKTRESATDIFGSLKYAHLESSEEWLKFGYLSNDVSRKRRNSKLDIESFMEKGLLFSCCHEGKLVDLTSFSELFTLGEEMFYEAYHYGGYWSDVERDSKGCFQDCFGNLKLPLNVEFIKENVEEITGMIDVEIRPSEFNKSIVNQLIKENIENAFDELNQVFDSLEYISPQRGNQNRVLSASSNSSDIEAIVNEFGLKFDGEKGEFKLILNFINDSLSLFGLKGKIDIKRIENVASVLYLETGDKSVLLSDIGYGYSQLIPVFLKVGLIAMRNIDTRSPGEPDYDSSLLILEEPEANLHPDFQSKLADVIVNAGKLFNIQFIIETHSEYFIRKLQYLTAKKELLPEHSVIYYFTNPNEVKEGEQQVREINIREDGILDDDFGSGFYDESTKRTIELLKIQNLN